jgi:hypothetical protein
MIWPFILAAALTALFVAACRVSGPADDAADEHVTALGIGSD